MTPDFRNRNTLLDHILHTKQFHDRRCVDPSGGLYHFYKVLGARTGEQRYWDWYQRIWAYSWEHFVDHRHGAWYRILSENNAKLTDEKSPAGKVDYHTMGACNEVLNLLEA